MLKLLQTYSNFKHHVVAISTFKSIIVVIIAAAAVLAMPLASSDDPAGMQYAFILALKPDGSLVLALFGGVFNMNDFAAAVERALHYTYFLEGAAKSFHIDFESYTSMVKALGHGIQHSCFNCGRRGEHFKKCEGCHFARYCSKKCQRQHWKTNHKTSCPTIGFDHRARRRAEHTSVWGTISGYDFDLWVHLAGDRARELPRITHVYNAARGDNDFSRVDASFVTML